MKIIFTLIVAFQCTFGAYCQVIRGLVLDSQSQDAISFASVYINGTFVGTHTDKNGEFSLDLAGRTFTPLTVSAIGYYSTTISEYSPNDSVRVFMQPKVYEMEPVVISAESQAKNRKANLEIFKREFLGSTPNASRCEIINEKDISFNYSTDKGIIKAYASAPLQIKNRALGYTVTYFLDHFEYEKSFHTRFMGNIIFTEDWIGFGNKQRFERRRRHAYLGSSMHFFRSLWSGQLETEGFKVTNQKGIRLDFEYPEARPGSYICRLKYPDRIYIAYSGKISALIPNKDDIWYNQDGQYNFEGISWRGYMASQRVGDWLPFEYKAEQHKL